jgi:membrane protein DedA with SNARE-associated domain
MVSAMSGNLWMLVLAYYGLAIVSAVVPWVNAELLMLSASPLAGSGLEICALVLAVSAGQMTGKAAAYWVSRRSAPAHPPRLRRAIERWRDRFERRPSSALVITFVSALVGVPPLFVVSIAAGALRVAFGRFMAVGSAGRLLHFALVAFAAEWLGRPS